MRAIGFTKTNVDIFKGGDVALRRQADELRELAARYDCELDFIESTSYEGHSRAFAELVRKIQSGEYDLILVAHIDRLTRKWEDLATIMETAREAGVGIVTLDGLDTRTAEGQHVVRIGLAMMAGDK